MAWAAWAIPLAIAVRNQIKEKMAPEPTPQLAKPNGVMGSANGGIATPSATSFAQPMTQPDTQPHGQARLRDLLGSGGDSLTESYRPPDAPVAGVAPSAAPSTTSGVPTAPPPQASPTYQPPAQEVGAQPQTGAGTGSGMSANQYAQLAEGIASLLKPAPDGAPPTLQRPTNGFQPSALQFMNRGY